MNEFIGKKVDFVWEKHFHDRRISGYVGPLLVLDVDNGFVKVKPPFDEPFWIRLTYIVSMNVAQE